ncbi:MAG: VWA domain-containing protein [Acidobacteriota bacterium]|nr:VWA domain-containing protein [Acidobacteriota bacterium]MDE2710463.1 VWA domain-containing protein [Acidobacteriota bacterium]
MRTVLIPVVLATVLAGAAFAPGQPPAQPPVEEARPETTEREAMLGNRFSFVVRVPSVTLDVVVADERGRFITGLGVDDFEILEDGVPQEIRYFTADLTPVTSLLLLDSSASVRSSLSAIQTAAYIFLRNMASADQGRVATFSEGVRFGPPYTTEIWDQVPMIRAMRPFGKTALYDAILTSLQELSRVEERKALVLVSDGEDSGPDAKGSVSTREQALEGARLSEGAIYTVGYTGWSPEGGGKLNREFLDDVAEQSGGRSYYPEKIEDLSRHFRQIQHELHRQYQIAYLPSRDRKEGGWRSIEVRIKDRDDLVARTRKGYYAAPDTETSESR